MSSRVRDASVWVNAPVAAAPALQAAVVRAGGAVSDDPGSANAIVWAMDDPPSIERYLAPSTEWVQLSSAGIEDWFQAGVIDERRLWTAAKGVYAKPIAEYVVAMLLTAARRLHQVVGDLEWRPRDVETLAGKTVGIIGAGGIGQAVVELLTPFGVQTIAMTRSGRNVSNAGTSVGPKALEQLLAQSDFVVLAAPETPQTIGMLSARQLALLQPHAWLVNVGRGTIIDTEALVEALEQRRIAGAALDVTDPEPLPKNHALWLLPNAIITGHTACTSRLGGEAFARRVADNVRRFRDAHPLLGLIRVDQRY